MGHVIDETAGLLLKFPDRGSDLRRLYMASESFRDLVRDFNDANAALVIWTANGNADRQREYKATLKELENAILDMLRQRPARDN
ncbi:hypothetical protein [Bosea sp. NBC_00550]|uniref:hypothetical protein n=1 Tax=Bosea sp. NBC_00550 TaxID=2969621 RepID=UPI00222EA439|nr:hypothetical protein [Bosea sp. NBC_00550]UZF92115.1 hypothetical protein NWE53_24085 [Bosea sp. NBC_00550]